MTYKTAYQAMLEKKTLQKMSGCKMEDPDVIAQKTIEILNGFKQYKHSEMMEEYNIIRKGRTNE